MNLKKDTVSISFPFNGFTYCLTLFSEYFSSFPHGTCSLSVSCQYLALDEVYHPLKTALSSSPTLWKGILKQNPGLNWWTYYWWSYWTIKIKKRNQFFPRFLTSWKKKIYGAVTLYGGLFQGHLGHAW